MDNVRIKVKENNVLQKETESRLVRAQTQVGDNRVEACRLIAERYASELFSNTPLADRVLGANLHRVVADARRFTGIVSATAVL